MSSTRNRNTIGDYQLEQRAYNRQMDYATYVNYGVPMQTNFTGDGLIGAKIPLTELSDNSRDIESLLFGIGSTNLVEPQPKIEPQIKNLKSLNMIDRIPVILPNKMTVEPNQRPTVLN